MRKINESLYVGHSDQAKPRLTPKDVGARFIETNTNVESRWTGSRWRTTESFIAELLHYVVGGKLSENNVVIKVGALLGTDITIDQAADSISIAASLKPERFIVPVEGVAPIDGVTPGELGQMIYSDSYLYICNNETTKEWKRRRFS